MANLQTVANVPFLFLQNIYHSLVNKKGCLVLSNIIKQNKVMTVSTVSGLDNNKSISRSLSPLF